MSHESTQIELTPEDNQTRLTLEFYQPSLTILKPKTEESIVLERPETVQLLFEVEQWLLNPQQTIQLIINDQALREYQITNVNQGAISDSISGLSAGTHQLTLVPQQNDKQLTDEAQTLTFHLKYASTTEPPSLSILTPDNQTLYINSHRSIKVDYRIDHWQYRDQIPHRWFLVDQNSDSKAGAKPQTIQYNSVNKPAPLQFTENNLILDTTYTLTIELTDINGLPTGVSDQITFTVKKAADTPAPSTSKKSSGQLQLSGLLLLLLWLLGCRFQLPYLIKLKNILVAFDI